MKNREMATAPYPARAKKRRVTTTGSNNRVIRVGYMAVIQLSDGSEVCCEHRSGHQKETALRDCANRIVARLNREAGIPKECW